MRVSRALVPLDYTSGDRFEPDPALPLPAFPLLQPLHRLAGLPAGAEQAKFIVVTLTRARNQFVHALREANAALDAVLANAVVKQPEPQEQPRLAKRAKGKR